MIGTMTSGTIAMRAATRYATIRRHRRYENTGTTIVVAMVPYLSIRHGSIPARSDTRPRIQNHPGA